MLDSYHSINFVIVLSCGTCVDRPAGQRLQEWFAGGTKVPSWIQWTDEWAVRCGGQMFAFGTARILVV